MLAVNVSADVLAAAAADIGVTLYNLRNANAAGTRHRFTLRPIVPAKRPYREYGRYYRRGFHADRTVAAVCWHGHRDFFRRLFALAPTCKVQTKHTRDFAAGERWYTAANFENVYQRTDVNIGSTYNPMQFSEACWCGDTAYDRVLSRLQLRTPADEDYSPFNSATKGTDDDHNDRD